MNDSSAKGSVKPVAEIEESRAKVIDVPPYVTSFSASGNTVTVGGNAVIMATTSRDVGPTPYYLQIFDATTGGRVCTTGSGTSCSATVSHAGTTTHAYVAYVANSESDTIPPSGIVSQSDKMFVTWSYPGLRVSVTPSISCTSTGTITATTNSDVGPTDYYIEIFNGNGTLLTTCARGTTCRVSAACTGVYYAFLSELSDSFPPENTVASSNTGVMYLQPR